MTGSDDAAWLHLIMNGQLGVGWVALCLTVCPETPSPKLPPPSEWTECPRGEWCLPSGQWHCQTMNIQIPAGRGREKNRQDLREGFLIADILQAYPVSEYCHWTIIPYTPLGKHCFYSTSLKVKWGGGGLVLWWVGKKLQFTCIVVYLIKNLHCYSVILWRYPSATLCILFPIRIYIIHPYHVMKIVAQTQQKPVISSATWKDLVWSKPLLASTKAKIILP